jgi:hypothetical protein
MSKHRLVLRSLAALLVATAAVGPVLAAGTSEPSPPVTVERTFVGTDEDREHAVEVMVTVKPIEETGAINDTVITIAASDAAFIGPSTVSTTETAGGDQVVARRDDQPTTFDIDRLAPGETVSITLRVYPKSVLPSGETLTTVTTETQFVQTQRVVSAETTVAPSVNPSQAGYAAAPPVSPLTSAAVGAASGSVLALTVAAVYWRRRKAALRGLLRAAKGRATTHGAQEAIEDALARVGGGDTAPEEPKLNEEINPTEDAPTFNFGE